MKRQKQDALAAFFLIKLKKGHLKLKKKIKKKKKAPH